MHKLRHSMGLFWLAAILVGAFFSFYMLSVGFIRLNTTPFGRFTSSLLIEVGRPFYLVELLQGVRRGPSNKLRTWRKKCTWIWIAGTDSSFQAASPLQLLSVSVFFFAVCIFPSRYRNVWGFLEFGSFLGGIWNWAFLQSDQGKAFLEIRSVALCSSLNPTHSTTPRP